MLTRFALSVRHLAHLDVPVASRAHERAAHRYQLAAMVRDTLKNGWVWLIAVLLIVFSLHVHGAATVRADASAATTAVVQRTPAPATPCVHACAHAIPSDVNRR